MTIIETGHHHVAHRPSWATPARGVSLVCVGSSLIVLGLFRPMFDTGTSSMAWTTVGLAKFIPLAVALGVASSAASRVSVRAAAVAVLAYSAVWALMNMSSLLMRISQQGWSLGFGLILYLLGAAVLLVGVVWLAPGSGLALSSHAAPWWWRAGALAGSAIWLAGWMIPWSRRIAEGSGATDCCTPTFDLTTPDGLGDALLLIVFAAGLIAALLLVPPRAGAALLGTIAWLEGTQLIVSITSIATGSSIALLPGFWLAVVGLAVLLLLAITRYRAAAPPLEPRPIPALLTGPSDPSAPPAASTVVS
jgi:hypothetical protein